MEAVLASWLPDGGLPIVRPYEGFFQYISDVVPENKSSSPLQEGDQYVTGGTDDHHDKAVRWEPGRTTRQALAPIVELTMEELLSVTQKPIPEGHSLYIAIRSAYQMGPVEPNGCRSLMDVGCGEGTAFVLCAIMLFPVVIEGALPIDRTEQPDFFRDLVLLHRNYEEPLTEPLRTIWRTLRDARQGSEEARARWAKANERAERLLVATLDEEQLAEFQAKRRFSVRAPDGHEYLIIHGSHGNVVRLQHEPDGTLRAVTSYCIVTSEYVPLCDQMLGQKLLLETDLEAFMSISNQTAIDIVVNGP